MSWNIEGTYFESCNCEAACPCVFLSKPTEAECHALVAWHIERGAFDEVPLANLNVALAARSPGHMAEVKWDAAVYLDAQADERQRDALVQIFGGRAGGHPARLASHIGRILGVAAVPMTYVVDGRRRSLAIPKIADVDIEALEGQGGQDIRIENHPLCIAPGQAAVVARSRRLRYDDHHMHWQLSGRNGFYSPFRYAA